MIARRAARAISPASPHGRVQPEAELGRAGAVRAVVDVPAKRGRPVSGSITSTAHTRLPPWAHPRAAALTNARACSGPYGRGAEVQRTDSGSWHCSTIAASSLSLVRAQGDHAVTEHRRDDGEGRDMRQPLPKVLGSRKIACAWVGSWLTSS